jgi:deoxyribodipyrimidine photolyase-related protein
MFLILPTQLYDIKLLKKLRPKITRILLWEHPQYFTKYNYNIKKLILHRAAMRSYLKELKRAKFAVDYCPYDEDPKGLADYRTWDPVDNIKLPGRPKIIESPNFLLSKNDYTEFYSRVKKRMVFNNFYIWGKNKLKLFPELRSLDKQNRSSFTGRPPKLSRAPRKTAEIKEAEAYIMARFKKNIGRPDGFNYPTTRTAALKSLRKFIKTKFNKFGPYQDFVNKTNPIMYHSVLSSSLNIGLLCPSDIIKAISKVRRKIAANSFEGFVRQLFWREYQRLCYIHVDFKKYTHKNKGLLNSAWYTGTLGVEPIDDLIKSGIEIGYIHHIGRLMFVGNYMNLSGISPTEAFKWFMEFAIDSYEWVMYQNVYDMVFYSTKGHTTTRPYLCSSKYALRMSNYKKGEWCEKWDALYRLRSGKLL